MLKVKPDTSTAVTIRKVTPADLSELVRISKQTYFESFFEAFDDPQGFNDYTAELFTPEQLNAELTDSGCAFYFALLQNSITGYIKLNFTTAQTLFQSRDAVEVERIYVLASYQNQQIGKALLDHAIAIAHQKDLKCIWLCVWDGNTRAIRFYKRYGFLAFDTHYYEVGNDRQTDHIMKIVF